MPTRSFTIITVDKRQRIQMFNESAASMFGVVADEVIGQTLDRFLPLRSRDSHRGFVDQFALDGVTLRRKGIALNSLMALRFNGQGFPIEAAISKAAALGAGAKNYRTQPLGFKPFLRQTAARSPMPQSLTAGTPTRRSSSRIVCSCRGLVR